MWMKLRRVLIALLLAASLAAGATSVASASCAKRVVVYLDISGSMDPTLKHVDRSPYRRSLAAIEGLLGNQSLIDSGDVVELAPFGETVLTGQTAKGPDEIGKAIANMRTHLPTDDTNLGNVLSDMARRLSTGRSDFARQLFIIASDFAEEPSGVRHDMAGKWATDFAAARPTVELAMRDNPRVAFVIFRAAATGKTLTGESRMALQERVITDLKALFGDRFKDLDVDAANLSKQLRLQLLSPPTLDPHLAPSSGGIEVAVTNPNCVPLTLSEVAVQCADPSGSPKSQPVTLSIPEADRTLAPTGLAEATRRINAPRPEGDCWRSADRLLATATTVDGLEAKQDGPLYTTMTFKPTAALREDYWFFKHILRLELSMRGQFAGPRAYDVEVKDPAGAHRIAGGRVTAPADLSPDSDKAYRIQLPLHPEVVPHIEDGTLVSVSLRDSQVPESVQTANVPIRADDARAQTEGVSSVTSILALLVGFCLFITGRRDGAMALFAATNAVIAGVLGALGFAWWFFRRYLLDHLALGTVDRISVFTAVLAAAAAAFALVRAFHFRRLARIVYGTSRFNLDEYLSSVQRGWSATLAAVLAALAVATVVWSIDLTHPGQPAGHPTIIPLLEEEH